VKSKNKASAGETLEWLENVVTGTQSFADREVGIERARQLKDSNFRQDLAEQKALIEKESAEAISLLQRAAEEEKALIRQVSDTRQVRIDKAQIEVRNQVIAGIQQVEGARRFQLQREFMEAGRERESRLARTAAEYAEKSAESQSIQSRFLKLEKAAVKSLKGFRSLQLPLIEGLKSVEAGSGEAPSAEDLLQIHSDLAAKFRKHQKNPIVGLFNGFPLVLQIFLLLLIGGGAPFASTALGGPALSYGLTLGIAGALSIACLAMFFAAKSASAKFLEETKDAFVNAKGKRLSFKEAIESWHEKTNESIEADFIQRKSGFEKGLGTREGAAGADIKYAGPEEVEQRAGDLKSRIEKARDRRIGSVDQKLALKIAEEESRRDARIEDLEGNQSSTHSDVEGELQRQFGSLVEQWQASVLPGHQNLVAESAEAKQARWFEQSPSEWEAPRVFLETLRFGEIDYDGESNEIKLPKSENLQLPDPISYAAPMRLRIPDMASILIETKQFGRNEAVEFLNYLTLGWLANSPPGRLSFSFVDPVGLGESFAGLMHLSDYEEVLINSRIRTQPDQIDQRVGELCDHMEKVIQMYLRSDYETITQYNEAAGTIAERYHFLVVADFPNGFTEQAARRLMSIASSGARCGVFLLIHCDQRATLPSGFQMEDLRKACLCLRSNLDGFFLKDNPVPGARLTLDQPPGPEIFSKWVHRIGEANRDSNRIEVPFSFIAPPEGQLWSGNTAKELTVPIGRSGATKLQQLALGKGTCQHALIAGKTGSGKSTLFHVIVSNLALWCDPHEVEFYLIDFKKGVEFKCYADAQLPHARVIAIESDREFGLSVLQRLDEELKDRGELFRAAGVQDVPGYRATPNAKPMPRTLLLIDEFQEFFTQDDQISQQAAVLLDRIVRQGRAFGIHAVLGSQTLGGAFTLARATLGQMTVRIALACNEADAYLIMDDSNPAPRLLTRPGEGIYNDRAGAVEANSPFQVVWLDEKERDKYLTEVRERAIETGKADGELVVFEGNAPGDVTRDTAVRKFLDQAEFAGPPRIFLGAPNAIKGPTEIRFERQSGSNLLIVGQRDDAVDSMTVIGLKLLREQLGEKARLVLVDNRFAQPDDSSFFCEAVRAIGGVVTPNAHEFGDVINEIAAEMKQISNGESEMPGGSTFLFIPSLHRYKKLRYEEDFSFSLEEETEAKPATSLNEIITEGSGWGFHVITSVDSYNNVNRCLGRKAAGEFEKKVLFQMSAADSASLIDSGAAADLGLNRALSYDEPTGTVEIFRPYAEPPLSWFSA
jgi:hypothetical protein